MLGDIYSEAKESQDLAVECSRVKVHSYPKVPSHWYFSKISILKNERKKEREGGKEKASPKFLEEQEGITAPDP